ncbi:CAMK family protein kinase [Tritrichomonas foetus]|uniref:CAMK family protein kinase n=1 Tax=Tritrichomonas foetus TaxID=1144522 RepID=A0A1J4K294_9EUKA|nr:CAMK family protein kinase [Tritrichomonas foetus]|eukprot:OHT05090.1 CAMK family protein kinase [Tritrichomonas foetus]
MGEEESDGELKVCIIWDSPFVINRLKEAMEKHDYIMEKKIGSGGFSVVYLAESVKYHQKFVVKVTPHDCDSETDAEISLLMKLSHPNIIQIYEYFFECDFMYIVLEYCPGGSLQSYVKKNGPLPTHLLYPTIAQIISALHCCHSHNIAHRDIKPANILIDKHGRPKLADFGLSCECTNHGCSHKNEFAGSRPFMSPELILKRRHDPFKSDIWALGVTIYYMLVGETPWPPSDKQSEFETAILMGMITFTNLNVDFELVKLIKKMIEVNENKRATIEYLMELDIIKANILKPINLTRLSYQGSLSKLNLSIPQQRKNISLARVRRASIAESEVHTFRSLPIGTLATVANRMNSQQSKKSLKPLSIPTFAPDYE